MIIPALTGKWRSVLQCCLAGLVSSFGLVSPVTAKDLPQGTHILTMVAQLASKAETLATGEEGFLGKLHQNGITDEEIVDGSVAVGIVYCCGGSITKQTMWVFYVPPEFQLAVGDVVELEVGKSPNQKKGEPGVFHRIVRVRESFEDETGSCRWDPEDDRMWARILYCDWMEEEGWKYKSGLSKTWYKPPVD